MTFLESIEIERLRSFRSKVKITFPQKGLVHLNGHNLDTGGSSGSGKSSVLLAIQYALGKTDIPSTELRSWGEKAPPGVALNLTGSQSICIDRGRSLKLSIDGKDEDGSAGQKEERFAKAMGGLDPEMIQALTYRGQRKPGLFLNKADAAKKDFLTRVLGLDKFEREIVASAKRVTDLEKVLLGTGLEASAAEMQLEELEPDANAVEVESAGEQLKLRIAGRQSGIEASVASCAAIRADAEVVAKTTEELFAPQLIEAKANVADLRGKPVVFLPDTSEIDRLTKVASQCAARAVTMTAEDDERRAELDKLRSEANKKIQALNLRAGASDGLLRDQSRINRELAKLVVDVCPTCERDWDKAQERRAQLEGELLSVNAKLTQCALIMEEVEGLIQEVAKLPKFEANPLLERVNELKSKTLGQIATEKQKHQSAKALQDSEHRRTVAEAEAAVAKIVNAKNVAVAEVRDQAQSLIADLQIDAETERRALAKDQAALAELQTQLGRLQARAEQAAKLTLKLIDINARYAATQAELNAEKDYGHLIGRDGFLGSIFDEVLAEISDETNKVLGSVANTRHVALQFRSENLTKAGTIEREIKPVVTVYGHETSLRGGLSGGMLSTVELAVDLAVGAVVSRRSGVCPGWLILDESFDGLDTVSKETCIEILQTYAQDRLVLVVDHASECQGMFTHSIDVQYQNGVSWV